MAQAESRAQGKSAPALPVDHDAERSVLGGVLLDHESLYKVQDKLKADYFDQPRHRLVYSAFLTLAEKGSAVNLVSLKSWLDDQGQLERAGGVEYLAELSGFVPTAAHIEEHARIVRDKALARTLIRTCEQVASRGYEGASQVQDLIEDAERAVLQVAAGHIEQDFRDLKTEIESTFVFMERVQSGELTGLRSGFDDLDQMTGGFSGGDLVVLAARPSMGKTALALNMARNVAVDHAGCVGLFSLEMSTRQLVLRMLMAEAQIDFSRFRNGYLGERDWPRLTRAAGILQDARIFIDDSGSLTVTDISAKARRLHREQRLSLLVVDYIQLIQGRRSSDRREQEVAETTRLLKLLAKDLDIPVIAISQLNRGPEGRSNPHKRPVLADLRESGAIEQDADIVCFIYRDEFYNDDTVEPGIAELIVSKQRNGPTGTLKLQFEDRCARFHDLSEREAPPANAGFDPAPGVGEDDAEGEPPF